jgi:YaiO family outer membrane protein
MKHFLQSTILIYLLAVFVSVADADKTAARAEASSFQTIGDGYDKAGTGEDLTAPTRSSGETKIKQAAPAAAASSLSEKSSPEALQKDEPRKPAGEKNQEKTVAQETVANAAATPQESAIPETAQETPRDIPVANTEKPRRIEASYSFNNLHPHGEYGDWNAGQIAFYDKISPDFTYFVQGALFNRNEGNGAAGTVGAYKGWTSFLYTCTSVTVGTQSDYLPKYRVDNDFNFSVWPSKNVNFITGISYLEYFDDQSAWIFSGGPMITFEKWSLHYRLFYNISDPGSISSFSHLISLGYGQEGWQWTYLNVLFGNQAYMTNYLVTSQEVNQNALSIDLQHRHWLGKDYGIFGDVSYFKLEEGYEMYGIGLGVFYEF